MYSHFLHPISTKNKIKKIDQPPPRPQNKNKSATHIHIGKKKTQKPPQKSPSATTKLVSLNPLPIPLKNHSPYHPPHPTPQPLRNPPRQNLMHAPRYMQPIQPEITPHTTFAPVIHRVIFPKIVFMGGPARSIGDGVVFATTLEIGDGVREGVSLRVG